MLAGAESTCIGALRLIDFGNIRMVHQLDSIDDEAHSIAWHAVAHPLNRSAFPGSFCQDCYKITMIPVTMGNVTFVELYGRFKTEPENVKVRASD
ncbi:hypothetical protein WJX84_005638 [Apatococcus fuscideae]|uniref:Uncharacterized protein n=1 Tax=Apatococcus fuscideae TaxID=2026836 RepID=A0AAW1T881_9CHLO